MICECGKIIDRDYTYHVICTNKETKQEKWRVCEHGEKVKLNEFEHNEKNHSDN